MSTIKLSQMYIYPVKSLPGISVDHAILTPQGLLNDRRWMLVDEKKRFITQRLYPRLALLKVSLSDNSIHIKLPNNKLIVLALHPESGSELKVKVWKDEVLAIQTDDTSNRIISEFLGISCQFVFMPETTVRRVDPEFSITTTDQVSFADGFPLLLISESSLQDLNHRLAMKNISPLPMIRFRPNIVVNGCDAFAEDFWGKFMVGENHLLAVKPCSRCVMTTVNPETGEKGTEPLATLLEYRKTGNKAYFGQNVLLDVTQENSMSLSIGDEVRITQSDS